MNIRTSHLPARSSVFVPLVILASFLLPSPASAALRFSHQLTGFGEPVVPFSGPSDVAVNADGDVYVADENAKAVDEFGPLGESLRALKGWTFKEGTPEEEFKKFGFIHGIG